MADTIKIKKGLTINLLGEATKEVSDYSPSEYALKPTDFTGVFPRLLVKEGDLVNAGTPVFHDKLKERIVFCSPVSGVVKAINRGEKRVLQEIVITPDEKLSYEDFGKLDSSSLSREEIIEKMVKSGVWPMIRQRPYTIIANPDDKPKSIFVSGFDSSPLAPDLSFVISSELPLFKAGMDVLMRLTEGKLHLGLPAGQNELAGIKGVETTFYSGPHPAGNVGVQIHHREPINKGDIVWIVNAQDVLVIGRLFQLGVYDPAVTIALTGSEAGKQGYLRTRKGASLKGMFPRDAKTEGNMRIISGNVLTGEKVRHDGYLGFYHQQVTVIPEGNHHEFFGWAMPGFSKFSFSKSYFSWLTPGKKYKLDTNLHGGERALVMTGQYEKVFPMDILPMQLIKACIIEDIDLMEKLGIYEIDEEDFALVEFIDTSKTDIQKIIRKGLDLVRKEMS
ncbi:MAG: Na(+)-translocating NADH-quinone reductase subunit A [Bacteroidales bacterium]|nr:Na(+)-translocating NADH-quinone reductase subunit A [Bacteroidales bacterium]